jgi:recombination protein RecA
LIVRTINYAKTRLRPWAALGNAVRRKENGLEEGSSVFEINYGKGIDRTAEILELGSKDSIGVIDRSGSWYLHAGERLGQGRDRAAEALDSRPELREQIVEEILAKARTDTDAAPIAAAG